MAGKYYLNKTVDKITVILLMSLYKDYTTNGIHTILYTNEMLKLPSTILKSSLMYFAFNL